MKKYNFAFIIIVLCLLFSSNSFSQVTVTPYSGSIANLIRQNFISDSSVELVTAYGYEPKFNGQTTISYPAYNQLGTFTNANTSGTNMPLSSGIVMVTGICTDAGSTSSQTIVSSVASPPCENCALSYSPSLYYVYRATGATNSMNDVACMSFWIVPKSERISFGYSFASEEYPNYVCSSFNDVFGFFISGPYDENGNLIGDGSVGEVYQNENIAIIPNTDDAVMINTVNGGESHGSASPCILTNTQYFRSNYTNPSNNCEMGGYTVDLTTKKIEVAPCYRYRIELAIADIGDKAYNSAVYLKANSLQADMITISGIDDEAIEHTQEGYPVYVKGCSKMKVKVESNYRMETNKQYSVEVSKTAGSTLTLGEDYVLEDAQGNEVGSTVTILRNEMETDFYISFLHNPNKEALSQDTLLLVSEFVNDCTPRDTIYIVLREPAPMDAYAIGGKTYCDNELPLTEEITVVSKGGHKYMRTVITNSLNENPFEDLTRYENADSVVVVFNPVIHDPVLYYIAVEDSCGRSFFDTIEFKIQGANTTASISEERICEGDQVTLSCPATAEYTWTSQPVDETLFGQETVREPKVTPSKNTQYTVTIKDENGCIASDSVSIIVVPKVKARMSLSTHTLRLSDATLLYEDVTINGADRFWDLGDGTTTNLVAGAETYPTTDTGTYEIMLVAYNSAGCADTAVDYVRVLPDFTFYIPNAFIPGDADEKLSIFRPVGSMLEYYTLDVYNRWGAKIFSGKPNEGWDGRVDDDFAQQGTYVYDIYYKDGEGLLQRKTGTFAVLPKSDVK